MKGLLSDSEVENLLAGYLKASGGSAPEEELKRFFARVDYFLLIGEMIRCAANHDDIYMILGDDEEGDFVFCGAPVFRAVGLRLEE